MPGQESMPDNLGLLLDAIAIEQPAGFEPIVIAAERMTHQRQPEAPALLRLPDVDHLVNEQTLPGEIGLRKIVAVAR